MSRCPKAVSRALARGNGTKTSAATAPNGGGAFAAAATSATMTTPEQRLSRLARLWARTRDAPELGVMYVGVLAALSLLVYTASDAIFDTRHGEHVGILLRPDVRGDFDRQLGSAERSARAAAACVAAAGGGAGGGEAAAATSGPAGGRPSLWYRLGHVMVDDKGPNVSVPPFDNRSARGAPLAYGAAKPGAGGGGARDEE